MGRMAANIDWNNRQAEHAETSSIRDNAGDFADRETDRHDRDSLSSAMQATREYSGSDYRSATRESKDNDTLRAHRIESAERDLFAENMRGVSDDASNIAQNQHARDFLDSLPEAGTVTEDGQHLFGVLDRNSDEYKNSFINSETIADNVELYNSIDLKKENTVSYLYNNISREVPYLSQTTKGEMEDYISDVRYVASGYRAYAVQIKEAGRQDEFDEDFDYSLAAGRFDKLATGMENNLANAAIRSGHYSILDMYSGSKGGEELAWAWAASVGANADLGIALGIKGAVKKPSVTKGNVKEQKLPQGITYEGTIYRYEKPEYVATTWEHHTGNVNANHRYTASGQGGTYGGTSEETALKEIQYYGADAGRVSVQKDVKLNNTLDLTNPNVREQLGVSYKDIISDDYTKTQQIGAWAKENGFDSILAPSARNINGSNIVILKND